MTCPRAHQLESCPDFDEGAVDALQVGLDFLELHTEHQRPFIAFLKRGFQRRNPFAQGILLVIDLLVYLPKLLVYLEGQVRDGGQRKQEWHNRCRCRR